MQTTNPVACRADIRTQVSMSLAETSRGAPEGHVQECLAGARSFVLVSSRSPPIARATLDPPPCDRRGIFAPPPDGLAGPCPHVGPACAHAGSGGGGGCRVDRLADGTARRPLVWPGPAGHGGAGHSARHLDGRGPDGGLAGGPDD